MRRILVIDDDDQYRSLLVRALTDAGHVVRGAANGRAGLRELSQGAVDVVITDLLMPDMDGIEIVATLRRESPHVRIVAISGGGRIDAGEYLRLAQHLGADRTLRKPFTLASLCAAIDELERP